MAESSRRAFSANCDRKNVKCDPISSATFGVGRDSGHALTETSPLLNNMEDLVITDANQLEHKTENRRDVSGSRKKDLSSGQLKNNEGKPPPQQTGQVHQVPDQGVSPHGNIDISTGQGKQRSVKSTTENEADRKRTREMSVESSADKCDTAECVNVTTDNGTQARDNEEVKEAHLDIVRKMSETGSSVGLRWKRIGTYRDLKQARCQRLYAKSRRDDDLALFFANGRFFAMEAWCSHMGGPLFQGDIEDYNGRCHVMCPWHSYMFDLEKGTNEIGLRQKTYRLKYEDGAIYIYYHTDLSLQPTRKESNVKQVPKTSGSVTKGVARKDSVLETPITL